MEYRLNECALLHLDAGQDRNGNARRAFALMHGPSGQIIAYADYGQQTNAGYALQEILYAFRHGASSDALMHELILRSNGERVRVAPSYLTHLRGKEVRARGRIEDSRPSDLDDLKEDRQTRIRS